MNKTVASAKAAEDVLTYVLHARMILYLIKYYSIV